MASQLLKTVKPSGGDYTSLEACLNANEQDLVTADQWFDVEISGTWSSPDTTHVDLQNYTTDVTRYINIYTIGEARHDGTYGGYSLELVNTHCITVGTNGMYWTLDGLCFKLTNGGNVRATIYLPYGRVVYATIKNCILYNTGSGGGYNRGISLTYPTGEFSLINNIVYGFDATSSSGFIEVPNNRPDDYVLSIYNNTVYGCVFGITVLERASQTGAINIKNNLCYNCTLDYGAISVTATDTASNLSSDASSPDSLYRNKTITFVDTTDDTATADFHLVSGDTDAIGEGVDLSGIFTEDIDGETRSSWDIGSDEFTSSGTDVTVLPSVQTITSSLEAPVIDLISNPTVTPNVQTLTSALYSPSIYIEESVIVEPSTQTVSATLHSPTIFIVEGVIVLPNSQSITSSLLSPTVYIEQDVNTQPAFQSLSLTLQTPSIDIINNITLIPAVLELTSVLKTSIIYIEANITVTLEVQTLTLTVQEPVVDTVGNVTSTPNVFATVLTLQSATVYIQSDVVILPNVFEMTSTLYESEIIGTVNISVDVLTMTLTFEDIIPQSKTLPDTFTFNVTQYSPQLHWAGTVEVAVLTIDTELGDIIVELDFARKTVRILKTTIEDYLGMKTLALKPDNKIGVIKPDNVAKIVISDNKTKILQSDNITKII